MRCHSVSLTPVAVLVAQDAAFRELGAGGGEAKGGDPGTRCTTPFWALCTLLSSSYATTSPVSVAAVFFREQGEGEAEDSLEPLGAIRWFNRYESRQLIIDCQRRQPVDYAPSQKRAGIAWVTPRARGDGGLFENGFGSRLEISVRHVQQVVAEHQSEDLRLFHREPKVGPADRQKTVSRFKPGIGCYRSSGQHGEALGGDGGQKRAAVPEMPEYGGGRNAVSFCTGACRQRRSPALAHKLYRRREQPSPEIAVVIAFTLHHSPKETFLVSDAHI